MMVIPEPSPNPSQAEFERVSQGPSRLGAKSAAYSDCELPAPGRTSPYLELHLVTANVGKSRAAGLTERDVAILQALDSYRYLDRHQIQTLFFQGPRSCQYRLKRLVEQGLVHAWKTILRPGHVRSASIYLLTAHGAAALAHRIGEDPRPYVLRAQHALSRNHHLVHDLEANWFFVALARQARESPTIGLYHWVGEHGIRRAYGGEPGPVADGWGRMLVGDGELFLHLEWDHGSEQTRRLHGKLAAYVSYFRGRPQASSNHVLFVVPTEQRDLQVRRIAFRLIDRGEDCCQIWTARRAEVRSGPLGAVWANAAAPDGRRGIVEMPSRPAGGRPIGDCIGKPMWWERRPGGGEGV